MKPPLPTAAAAEQSVALATLHAVMCPRERPMEQRQHVGEALVVLHMEAVALMIAERKRRRAWSTGAWIAAFFALLALTLLGVYSLPGVP